jgi:hypothetical protein
MRFDLIHEKLALSVGLGLAAITGLVASRAIPAFGEVYQSFGTELPWVTSMVLSHYPFLFALPLLVLAAWLTWPRRESRGLAALATGVASIVAVPVLLAIMLYLPILRSGF